MIPQRIKLKGFLCYKDEQEICFDGASLWMLAGINGSGKSSIFDAVTYALFGHHRGGSQHAHELINKDCDRLAVEFEFTLDGQPYLVRRTLQRTAKGGATGTQMIYRRSETADNGQKGWVPIEGTSRKADYDAWVRDNIGLTYETFTSSILLLQGKAEKLLDSTAKGRFEVLASIVDLERYEKLHKRADEQRKKQEAHVANLHDRLAALPEVTALSLVEADEQIASAEAARQQAQKEVERLQELEFQARQWGELQGRLAVARQRWQQAQQLLANAADIEQAVTRLQELREVLPRLQTVIEQRGQIHESEAKTGELLKQKQRLEALFLEKDHALEQTRQKRTSLERHIAADEQRHRDVAERFRKATGLLEKLKEYERQQADRTRLQEELARLPADPEAAVRLAQETCDRLTALAQAVPHLTRLQSQREELRHARVREREAAQARQTVQQKGEQLAAKVDRLKPEVEEAMRALRQATDEATRLRTLWEQAQEDFAEITNLQGAKVCRHCGQPLTEGHLRDEKRRREKEVARAEADYRAAIAAQQAAQKREQELRAQLTELEQQFQAAREEYREHRRQAEQAQADIGRLERDCAQVYAELAEPFRSQVSPTPPADWLETTFPSPADLSALRQQAAGLSAARQRLQEAAAVVQRWHTLKAQEAAVAASLARLQAELPADPQAVRKDHVRLEAEEQALDQSLKARRAEAAEAQKQIDRLTKEREQVQQQIAEVNGRLSTEEATRQHCQQTLNRTLRELPPAWQKEAEHAAMKELFAWQGEKKSLEAKGTDERGRQLQQARAGLETLCQDLAALEKEQDRFPPEARQEPAAVQAALQQARRAQRERDDELVRARQHKAQLESYQQQRQQLQEELLQAEKELTYAKLLAELLGRDRLQLHLVRQAERQVVDHANAVLDRLSGGQLYLRLCGEAGGEGNTAKALELEAYNRITGEKPINVAFLSGSQKFRVAVSLALGIGQYASRQHRPIESVIIDEGFGCLDKEGRQAMIQELQNLRGHLRCILLVSHQEEFADAFADGYRFELANGATRVTRFQR
ncbi:MAG TPA: SMC family ATPase [Gemmataceae bacterium]|nr:SMC family ATPase [Gemmataceae bacterium]